MRGWKTLSLRVLVLGASLSPLAAFEHKLPDTSARQNLIFAWQSLPSLVARCLQSQPCVGKDFFLLKALQNALKAPSDKQPRFVYHFDLGSEFCTMSRDVYSTTRVWSSPIQVCDPRLYHLKTREPLWSPEVALIEMAELALMKATLAQEDLISDLATRMAELSGVRVQARLQSDYAGIRVLALEDRDTLDVLGASLLAPGWQVDLLLLAREGRPCEKKRAQTLAVLLKRPRWVSGGTLQNGGSFLTGVADAVVDCRALDTTAVLKGSFAWRMEFLFRAPYLYEDMKLSFDFENLLNVSPVP